MMYSHLIQMDNSHVTIIITTAKCRIYASFRIMFQVKLQYLHYLHQLIHQMEMSEFINNADTRGAVSKIITWVEEPKSGDIRTAAKSVIVSMFNLNPPEFSALITGLQKTFQVGLSEIGRAHV